MTNTTLPTTSIRHRDEPRSDGHDWRIAGEAWGHAARDWSTLFEHYAVGAVATIGHAVGSPDPESMGRPPAPLVWFRPEQVAIDPARAVDLPDRATTVSIETGTALTPGSPMLLVTFEMPWVQGDFT